MSLVCSILLFLSSVPKFRFGVYSYTTMLFQILCISIPFVHNYGTIWEKIINYLRLVIVFHHYVKRTLSLSLACLILPSLSGFPRFTFWGLFSLLVYYNPSSNPLPFPFPLFTIIGWLRICCSFSPLCKEVPTLAFSLLHSSFPIKCSHQISYKIVIHFVRKKNN